MSDPPFDPEQSGTWPVPRTDKGARKLIERVDRASRSSKRWAAGTVVSSGVAVLTFIFARMDKSVERQDAQFARLQDRVDRLAAAAERNAALAESAALYAKGSFDVNVAQKPRAQVANEVRAAVSDGGSP